MVRSTLCAIVPLLLILGQTSCIRENLQQCEEEYFVTIKVVDALTGEDITTSGEVKHVDLFVFDANEQYSYTISVNSNYILQKIPIPITLENTDCYWISVWGNLDGNQQSHYPKSTSILDDLFVTTATDDHFFGIAQTGKSQKSQIKNEEIIISRKNARMYLTVRGLPTLHKAADYYFIIHLNNKGYNYKGVPISKTIAIKQNGITLANNDFVSPSAFCLVHTDTTRKDYVTIDLYKNWISET